MTAQMITFNFDAVKRAKKSRLNTAIRLFNLDCKALRDKVADCNYNIELRTADTVQQKQKLKAAIHEHYIHDFTTLNNKHEIHLAHIRAICENEFRTVLNKINGAWTNASDK